MKKWFFFKKTFGRKTKVAVKRVGNYTRAAGNSAWNYSGSNLSLRPQTCSNQCGRVDIRKALFERNVPKSVADPGVSVEDGGGGR